MSAKRAAAAMHNTTAQYKGLGQMFLRSNPSPGMVEWKWNTPSYQIIARQRFTENACKHSTL